MWVDSRAVRAEKLVLISDLARHNFISEDEFLFYYEGVMYGLGRVIAKEKENKV